jgi:hypothetical protein
MPGTDVMIFKNIFAKQFVEHTGVFCSDNFCKGWIITDAPAC